MLDQHRRRWVDVVQMLDKCFVFAGDVKVSEYVRIIIHIALFYSSLSSYINSLAAVCIEDFVKPLFLFLKRRKLPENSEKKWSITFCKIPAHYILC